MDLSFGEGETHWRIMDSCYDAIFRSAIPVLRRLRIYSEQAL
jgi:hypothetical protein